jgi:ATP-dependent RNA helicase RhlE
MNVVLAIGGEDKSQQQKILDRGVDIITATPGRIFELVDSNALDLSTIRFFVLDEADSLIEQNLQGILKLYNAIPKSEALQVFTAAMNRL